jgi:RNA recognition motif-containing protein
MANTVRISNLSEMTTEDQVRALFGEAGGVKSVQMVTNDDGRSVGAAFVELRNQVEVDKAIHLLNGKQYDMHTIEVTPV